MLAIKAKKSYYHEVVFLLLIILFSLAGMKALFHPGLFTAHDIWHQVVRLYYYSQAVNDGQFPPYWIGQLANGFGYPLFLFSYHLPWIIGVMLMKIGLDIPTAIKALFFLSYISSGITMYIFVNNFLKSKPAAFLSAVLYLWLPYHFLIIFISASMGIAFIFTFLPLVFLGIHLLKQDRKIGIAVLSIGIAGIILSHIMNLVFLLPIIALFFFWEFSTSPQKIRFIKNITFGLIIAVFISAFYLMPAIFYNRATRVNQESGLQELYKRNFINFNQLIYSKWNFSPIINNAKNSEVPFQLGIAQWIAISTLFLLTVFKKLNKSYRSLGFFVILSFISSIFLMLDFSKPLWNIFIKFAVVDFPFRFLLPTTFIASLAAGIVFINLGKKVGAALFLLLIIIAVYTNRNHLNVNLYTDFPISTYLNLETERTTNTFNEYLPRQANDRLLSKPWNEARGEDLSVSDTKSTTDLLSFKIQAKRGQTISVGQFYFPGQKIYLDNELTQSSIDKEGRINFTLPQGTHDVSVKYQPTLLIKISKYLTVIGLLLISLLIFKDKIPLKKKSYS